MQIGLTRLTLRGPVEHAVIELSGELDFSNADDLVTAIESLPHKLVAIDMSGMEFVDSAGARALDEVVSVRSASGARPQLTGTTPAVQRALLLARSRERVLR